MLQFYYLPLRARGEPLRMMLIYGHIEFDDNVILFKDWEETKNAKTICPFGQLPALKLDSGIVIAQSGAIAHYIAKICGIYPTDPEKCARADMIYELSQEMNMINPLCNYFPYKSEKWQTEYNNFFERLPDRLEFLSNALGEEQSYFGGMFENRPSHADFGIFHILDMTTYLKPDALDKYPLLTGHLFTMRCIPSIARYLRGRLTADSPDWGLPGSYIMMTAKPQTEEPL